MKYLHEFEYFTVFLKNRNFISKIKRSKVTEYAALNDLLNAFYYAFNKLNNTCAGVLLDARKSVIGGLRTPKAQTSLRVRAD